MGWHSCGQAICARARHTRQLAHGCVSGHMAGSAVMAWGFAALGEQKKVERLGGTMFECRKGGGGVEGGGFLCRERLEDRSEALSVCHIV